MARIHAPLSAFALVAGLLLAAGCGDDKQTTAPPDGRMPDFSLQDVNPNSATHDQAVSPRQHLERVSAWYFGSAT